MDQYKPETIEMSKATLDGNPIVLSTEQLIKLKGEPIEIHKDCYANPILFNQGTATYECWRYDSVWNNIYHIRNNEALLYLFSFENTNSEIKTPQIKLSNKTTFNEIKEKFPNSYAHRNIGSSAYLIDDYDWVYLNDDLPNERRPAKNRVTLVFNEGELIKMEYFQEPT